MIPEWVFDVKTIVLSVYVLMIFTSYGMLIAYFDRSDPLFASPIVEDHEKHRFVLTATAFLIAIQGPGTFVWLVIKLFLMGKSHGIKFRFGERRGSYWHKVARDKIKSEFKQHSFSLQTQRPEGNCVNIWANV